MINHFIDVSELMNDETSHQASSSGTSNLLIVSKNPKRQFEEMVGSKDDVAQIAPPAKKDFTVPGNVCLVFLTISVQ